METKLTEAQLALACYSNNVPATKENMAMMAFFNDADFRQKITRFYFDRAVRSVA